MLIDLLLSVPGKMLSANELYCTSSSEAGLMRLSIGQLAMAKHSLLLTCSFNLCSSLICTCSLSLSLPRCHRAGSGIPLRSGHADASLTQDQGGAPRICQVHIASPSGCIWPGPYGMSHRLKEGTSSEMGGKVARVISRVFSISRTTSGNAHNPAYLVKS